MEIAAPADAAAVEDVPAALEDGEEDADDRFGLPFARAVANQNGGGRFRVNNHRVLLTFAALYEGELIVDRAFTELVEKCRGGCDEIVVCQELHSNPAEEARRWHIHAYVKSKNKWDTTDRAYFDISGGHAGRHLHPHIQSMGRGVDHRDRVINYVTKDYNYRMMLEGPYKMERRSDSEEVDPEAWGERVRDAPNAQAAAVAVRTHNPNVWYIQSDRIMKRKRQEDAAKAQVGAGWKLSDFTKPALAVTTRAQVLWGDSGAGKTAFAVAHFRHPLVCSTLDDLKKFDADVHDGIVLDDVDCSALTPEACIQLLDMDHDRSIQLRYHPACIPQGTPRVFTTNRAPEFIFPRANCREQRAAIERRYTATEVREKLFEEE